ncbi:MAG: hypothetical protein ACYDBQ_07265 [Thermoplasmatota archaeon]
MTGFRGERQNQPVALVTDDFRLYHALAPFFAEHGIQILGLTPGEAVPPAVRVLLGGPPEDPRSVTVAADAEGTLLSTLAALDPRPGKRAGYGHVVFGVDPGHHIGLAAVADGHPLFVAQASSATEAARRLAAWAAVLSARRWEVHVGDGAPESGQRVVQAVRSELPQVPVVVVSEEGTSPDVPTTQSRHTDAAIRIALRSPRP